MFIPILALISIMYSSQLSAMVNSPRPMVMDQSYLQKLHPIYRREDLVHYPTSDLRSLGRLFLSENALSKQRLIECCCIRGCCFPCYPKIQEFEIKLRDISSKLQNHLNQPESAENREFLIQDIIEGTDVNTEFIDYRQTAGTLIICYPAFMVARIILRLCNQSHNSTDHINFY